MNTHKDIQEQVDKAFASMENIQEVKVSPFFKEKTMRRLISKKEEIPFLWSWFTPKLQLATLIGVVVLNVLAYTQLNSDTYNDTVTEFADTYELSPNEDTSIVQLID